MNVLGESNEDVGTFNKLESFISNLENYRSRNADNQRNRHLAEHIINEVNGVQSIILDKFNELIVDGEKDIKIASKQRHKQQQEQQRREQQRLAEEEFRRQRLEEGRQLQQKIQSAKGGKKIKKNKKYKYTRKSNIISLI